LAINLELIQNVADTIWHGVCVSKVAISMALHTSKARHGIITGPLLNPEASAKTHSAVLTTTERHNTSDSYET